MLYFKAEKTLKGGGKMIVYKVDILKELAAHGYTTTRLRREKLISESTLSRIRKKETINTTTINDLCIMLRCQPSDIIEVVATDEEKIKFF